jgi:hypothetical protein
VRIDVPDVGPDTENSLPEASPWDAKPFPVTGDSILPEIALVDLDTSERFTVSCPPRSWASSVKSGPKERS